MQVAFYIAAFVAIVSTVMMLAQLNAVHALLYLTVSLLAVAVVFYTLGAPLVAALEIVIYAGAIMVLFVFVVMMLNLGERATIMERSWLTPRMWIGPSILAAVLVAELAYFVSSSYQPAGGGQEIGAKQVAASLYGPYLIGVELASILLLAGLVGAYHLGQQRKRQREAERDVDSGGTGAGPGGGPVLSRADRIARTP